MHNFVKKTQKEEDGEKIGFSGNGCCHVVPPPNPNFFT
jgi:hypothetical protein